MDAFVLSFKKFVILPNPEPKSIKSDIIKKSTANYSKNIIIDDFYNNSNVKIVGYTHRDWNKILHNYHLS